MLGSWFWSRESVSALPRECQVGTNLSPTNPYTTITPLTVVLIITMIKQGIEDFKRHIADHAMNNRKTNVIRHGKLECVTWKDVVTGDMLLVHDREELPADIVILSTSEELGKCFIEVCVLVRLARAIH